MIGLLFKWLGEWLSEWVDKGKKKDTPQTPQRKAPLGLPKEKLPLGRLKGKLLRQPTTIHHNHQPFPNCG